MFKHHFCLLLFGALLCCAQIANSDRTPQNRNTAPDSSSFCNNWLCSAVLNLNTIGDLIDNLSEDSNSRNVEDLKGTENDANSAESISDKGDLKANAKGDIRAEDSDDASERGLPEKERLDKHHADRNRLAVLSGKQRSSNDPDNALDEHLPEDRDVFKDKNTQDDRAGLDENDPDRNGLDDTPDEDGIDSLFSILCEFRLFPVGLFDVPCLSPRCLSPL